MFISLLIGLCAMLAGQASAADLNKPEEAVAMVKKAIAYYQQHGRAATFDQINKLDGPFVNKEMFTFVLDANGTVLAHGHYHKMIGQNILNLRDVDGVQMVKGFFETVRTKGAGWVHYKFPNPITKVIEPKSTYVESVDGLLILCGLHTSTNK
jgi:signal transduction histidine kinase